MVLEDKYGELLKNQIYAHFPEVEVSETKDYLDKYKT